jgi:sarcosine oxidase subunit beta
MAGVDLPVTPVRRQILFTEPVRDLPSHLPMTIDFASSFYFHREGQGLLVGMSWPHEQPGFATGTTDDWIPDLLQVAERRAPIVARAGIRGGWAGLYEMSPDHNALIGEATMPSRFLYATGFSGHGFLQGPAVGEILRDLYLGREPFVSVHDLSANRFTQGATRPEMNIV